MDRLSVVFVGEEWSLSRDAGVSMISHFLRPHILHLRATINVKVDARNEILAPRPRLKSETSEAARRLTMTSSLPPSSVEPEHAPAHRPPALLEEHLAPGVLASGPKGNMQRKKVLRRRVVKLVVRVGEEGGGGGEAIRGADFGEDAEMGRRRDRRWEKRVSHQEERSKQERGTNALKNSS